MFMIFLSSANLILLAIAEKNPTLSSEKPVKLQYTF